MECLPIACAYKYLYIKAHVYRLILRHEIIRYVKFACVQNKNMHIKMCTCTALTSVHYDLSFSLMYVQSNKGTKMHYLLNNAKL
ncbi:hypothetical protein V1477_020361 [Vespula maculifrons]|uniref:Uncharacterized protein n=1 Tax=Vespula maculifrons TaxID=7453 RepID=A0ABD2ALQ0_VESMC